MDPILPLSSLRQGICDDKVCLKVLSFWLEQHSTIDSYLNFIATDLSGTKIEASIPKIESEILHAETIKEGEWYVFSGFHVVDAINPIRFSNHAYQIVVTNTTIFESSHNLSDSRYFQFAKSYAEIVQESTVKDFPTDIYGVVKKFWDPVRIPYVPKVEEDDYHCMALSFELVDHDGNFLKCFAIGDACLDFMTQWREGEYDLNYIERPKVFCVLQFWRISKDGEEVYATNCVGSSKILLNPDLDEFSDTKFVSFFTEGFYEVVKEKEEIQWF